jgi:hypothetical protein
VSWTKYQEPISHLEWWRFALLVWPQNQKEKQAVGYLIGRRVLLGRNSNDETMSIVYAARDAAGGGFGSFMLMMTGGNDF